MQKNKTVITASPRKRRSKRNAPASMVERGHQGIATGRLSPYRGEYRTTDQVIYSELNELVARARELAQNDGSVVKFAKLLSANVIGANGIGVKPKCVDLSGKLDSKANDIIGSCFIRWSKYPTIDNQMSWIDFQRIAVESLVRDGEVFIRIYRGDGFGPYKIQLQMLSPDYCDVLYNLTSSNIRSSIEYDKYNRPVAYWIYNRHPKDCLTGEQLKRQRIPATDCIHFYLKDKPDQSRGIPLISPVMSQILDLKHYKYLSLVAARVGAGTQGFITQTDPGKSKYRGNDDTEQAKVITTEPGTIQELPPGCDLKKYDPSYPIQGYEDYTKSVERDISSGFGLSYNDLFSDLNSVTYSSLRWGALSDREQYRMFQRLVIDTLIEPIFIYVVEMACLSGMLTDGKNKLPYSKIDKYTQAQFRPRSYPWIDPEKDQKAIALALSNQSITITKVLEEQGFDLEDILKERKREQDLSKQYGISLEEIYYKKNTGATNGNNNNAPE